MPKYYVKSGGLNLVLTAPNAFEAAIKGVRKAPHNVVTGVDVFVDERGFRQSNRARHTFDMMKVFEAMQIGPDWE